MATHTDGTPATVIALRPLASALPLGFFAFGIGMLMLSALTGEWIDAGQTPVVGLIVASFVFPVQLTSAVFALLSRDVVAGTVLGVFSTSWLAVGLILLTGQPGSRSAALGIFLLAFGAVLVPIAIVGMTGKPILGAILLISGTRAVLSGLYEVGGSLDLNHAAGVAGAVAAGLAWYGGTALLLEDLRQHAVLPTLRSGAAHEAFAAPVEPQAHRARGEAGVRQQL